MELPVALVVCVGRHIMRPHSFPFPFYDNHQVVGLGMELPVALACCLAASALVALLALVHALTLILSLVPNAIKLATVLGMGLLLSLIGEISPR